MLGELNLFFCLLSDMNWCWWWMQLVMTFPMLCMKPTQMVVQSLYLLHQGSECVRCISSTHYLCHLWQGCCFHCHFCSCFCLLAGCLKKLWPHFHEIYEMARLWTKKEVTKYRKCFGAYSGYHGYSKLTKQSTRHNYSRYCKISSEASAFTFVL